MQQLEGDFAQHYNLRKRRSGAFWNGRYHATMIEGGRYLWNCMRYIDLNMVRARAVAHPSEWRWCGYDELVGRRKRYRLIDIDRVLQLRGTNSPAELAVNYEAAIAERLGQGELKREPVWSACRAVARPEGKGEGGRASRWAVSRLSTASPSNNGTDRNWSDSRRTGETGFCGRGARAMARRRPVAGHAGSRMS